MLKWLGLFIAWFLGGGGLKRRGRLWGFVFIFYYCFCRESPGKLRLLNKLYIIIMSKFMSVHVLNNKINKSKIKASKEAFVQH